VPKLQAWLSLHFSVFSIKITSATLVLLLPFTTYEVSDNGSELYSGGTGFKSDWSESFCEIGHDPILPPLISTFVRLVLSPPVHIIHQEIRLLYDASRFITVFTSSLQFDPILNLLIPVYFFKHYISEIRFNILLYVRNLRK